MSRDDHEAALAAAIASVHEWVVQQLEADLGDPPAISNLPDDFWQTAEAKYRDAAKAVLVLIYLDMAEQLSTEMDYAIDLSSNANTWASNYSDQLAKALVQNRQQALNDAVKLGTLAAAIDALMAYLSADNAAMIAITETTEANSEATRTYERRYEVLVGALAMIVQTAEDDRVCDICAPKDLQPAVLVGFPPFHPNCRCGVRLIGSEKETTV